MAKALTIAGSDSGAGVRADLKTFSALGVYGASVITAITARNTREVIAVAAGLAKGRPLETAVREACAWLHTWLHTAIRATDRLGDGRGPVHHFRELRGTHV